MFYARKCSGSGRYTPLPVARESGFGSLSVGVQTPIEIAELSIRTSHPVAIYLYKSEATATRFYLCESVAAAVATITPGRK